MLIDDVLQEALGVKLKMDKLALLGDKLYLCMECGQVSSYWKPGGICQACERIGEEQQEYDHEHTS